MKNDSPYLLGYGLHFPRSPIISAIYRSQITGKKIKILDIGCGLGALADLAKVIDCEYLGIDIDSIAIKRAEQINLNREASVRSRVNFECVSLKEYTQTGSGQGYSFDLVLDSASLQHTVHSFGLDHDNLQLSAKRMFSAIGEMLGEEGILISLWASTLVPRSTMTKNFSTFVGFEEIAGQLNQILKLNSLVSFSTYEELNKLNLNSEEIDFLGKEYLSISSSI